MRSGGSLLGDVLHANAIDEHDSTMNFARQLRVAVPKAARPGAGARSSSWSRVRQWRSREARHQGGCRLISFTHLLTEPRRSPLLRLQGEVSPYQDGDQAVLRSVQRRNMVLWIDAEQARVAAV